MHGSGDGCQLEKKTLLKRLSGFNLLGYLQLKYVKMNNLLGF